MRFVWAAAKMQRVRVERAVVEGWLRRQRWRELVERLGWTQAERPKR